MQITDMLAQMGGLQSIARELGVSETQAASGASALIPAISADSRSRRRPGPPASKDSAGCSGSSAGAGCWMKCSPPSRPT